MVFLVRQRVVIIYLNFLTLMLFQQHNVGILKVIVLTEVAPIKYATIIKQLHYVLIILLPVGLKFM